jgi:hypothetical protein
MHHFSCIYYGIGFLHISAKTNSNFSLLDDKQIAELPAYSQFMGQIGRGEINLADAVNQQKLGYIFLLMRNLVLPG